MIFADLVDRLLEHRETIRRPLGKTASNTLARLKASARPGACRRAHRGLLAPPCPRPHVQGQRELADGRGRTSSTPQRSCDTRRATASTSTRTRPRRRALQLKDEGLRITSRMREGRISDKQLNALLAWIDANAERTHIPLGDVVRFALATAMRRGEIVSIRHEDLHGRVILVRNRKHPRDHERVDEAPLLQKHATWPRDDPLEIIKRQPTTSGRIFPYNPDTVGFWFEKACEAAGLKAAVFHTLRHEALSRYAEDRKMDAMRLQLIGGHRDLRHLQRYVKLDAARLANE